VIQKSLPASSEHIEKPSQFSLTHGGVFQALIHPVAIRNDARLRSYRTELAFLR